MVINWKADVLKHWIHLYPKDKVPDKAPNYCKVEVKAVLSPNSTGINACTTTCWHAYSSASSDSS